MVIEKQLGPADETVTRDQRKTSMEDLGQYDQRTTPQRHQQRVTTMNQGPSMKPLFRMSWTEMDNIWQVGYRPQT